MRTFNKPKIQAGFRQTFVSDLRASVVVFLVALPLCMGIALASGVPADQAAAVGIVTGIIGGIVVGFLGGCPLQVSGPAAGLSVLVFEFIRTHGFEKLGVVILLAGAIQLIAGWLRWGQLFRAVSPAVIQGMLAGIGILIIAGQFHIMLDHPIPGKTGLENLLAIPQSILDSLGEDPTHRWAARIGITTIVVMVMWGLFAPHKLRFLPAPLVGVVLATLEASFIQWEFPMLSISRVRMPDNLFDALQFPTWEKILALGNVSMWRSGVVIAVVASAETLLCAAAVDKLHSGPRAKYDKELMAQGVGNMLCGCVGALPMTGVIVRSAANVDAGAKTRNSAIIHGFWLLVFVGLFPFALSVVPISTLAAILVLTGYKLAHPKAVKSLWRYGKGEVFIYAATVITIVAEDLLTGVLVGIGLSAAKLLYKFSRLSIRLEEDGEKNLVTLHLSGTATFIRLPKLAAVLEEIPENAELHVNLERLQYIDHACLDLLMNWEKQHSAAGGKLMIDWEQLTARFREVHPSEPAAESRALLSANAGNGQAERTPTSNKNGEDARQESVPEQKVGVET